MIELANKWYKDHVMQKILMQSRRAERGCLEWIGKTTDGVGYGMICFLGKQVRVPRLMLEFKLGRSIKPGMYCCHTCDNRSCIEQDHLYEGTPSDNQGDRVSRGRLGENCGQKSRFYDGEVWLMKRLSGKVSQRIIARMFKASRSHISYLINNKTIPTKTIDEHLIRRKS